MQHVLSSFFHTPYGVPIFVVGIWCVACLAVSMMGGWSALARRFRKQSDPTGETRSAGPWIYSISMRPGGNYNGVIRLIAAQDALYASVLALLRPGHPPLRIPWNEITIGRSRRPWGKFVVLTLGSKEQIPMRISERMARELGILDRIPASPAAPSR